MNQSFRTLTRAGLAVAAASALATSGAAVASAQEGEAYPEPTVSTQVDGNNIITTITDNGGGFHNDAEVTCVNAGMFAIDALPLAALDPEDIDLLQVIGSAQWIELNNATTPEIPEVVVDANESRAAVNLPPLEPGVYASVGACLGVVDGDLGLVSMAYDAPVFVPGGIGSVGQALDLGSSALELDGGSSMLLDFGSEMLGS